MNEILSGCAVRAAIQSEREDKIATEVVRRVCELGDYTSPDDKPELLTCTADELRVCVLRALGVDI